MTELRHSGHCYSPRDCGGRSLLGRSPVFLAIPISDDFLATYGKATGQRTRPLALEALAAGIASSPEWPAEARPVVLGRPTPTPSLAVFGCFTDREIAGVRRQVQHLAKACPGLRAFDLPGIVEDCSELARHLEAHLGPEVRAARFAAIPKGGLTILGLVSVALGIDHSQLSPPQGSDELLVVVDDCALSGARFAEALERWPAPRVVFAHLCSHPDLRRSIEASEPRVEACFSVHDLEEIPTTDEREWRRRWREKASWKTYWTGFPQPIAFPWGEPDRLVWNPAARTIEKAWNLLPPSLCLKNRPQIPVQIQEAPTGPLRPADEVLFVREDEQIHLADLASGRSLLLDPVASAMWLAVVRGGTRQKASERLCQSFDAEPETIRRDLDRLVEELQHLGFLVDRSSSEIATFGARTVLEAPAD